MRSVSDLVSASFALMLCRKEFSVTYAAHQVTLTSTSAIIAWAAASAPLTGMGNPSASFAMKSIEILVPSKAYFPVDASLLEEAMIAGQISSKCGEVDVGGNE